MTTSDVSMILQGGMMALYGVLRYHHCEADWETQVPTWMQFLWM